MNKRSKNYFFNMSRFPLIIDGYNEWTMDRLRIVWYLPFLLYLTSSRRPIVITFWQNCYYPINNRELRFITMVKFNRFCCFLFNSLKYSHGTGAARKSNQRDKDETYFQIVIEWLTTNRTIYRRNQLLYLSLIFLMWRLVVLSW